MSSDQSMRITSEQRVRSPWAWILPLVLVVGGLAVVCLAAEKAELPTKPVVFHTGEVYLYGHKIDPPYTLAVADTILTLNGIPVWPRLKPARPARSANYELAARKHALLSSASAMQKELLGRGLDRSSTTQRVAEFVRSDTTLVLEVTDVQATNFVVRWRDGMRETCELTTHNGPAPQSEELLVREAEKWRMYLQQAALIVYGRTWACLVEREAAKVAVRAEIEKARNTPLEVFDRTERVLAAEQQYGEGLLPDSLTYLVGQTAWRGEYIHRGDARLFRDPLPVAGLSTPER